MRTRAAVAVEAGQPLEIMEVNLDGPRKGEVLVEIKATGLCHTDEFTRSGADPEGIFPAILGHEGAGVVVEVLTTEVQLPGGEPVDLVVSDGPEPRTVPDDLIGLTFEEAESQLAVLRLVAIEAGEYDTETAEGLVMAVDPAAGTQVDRGAEVTVTVSLGPPPVEIPDVIGQDLVTAANTLEGLGLCTESDGPLTTPVIGTDPVRGSVVPYGSCVLILTSQNEG